MFHPEDEMSSSAHFRPTKPPSLRTYYFSQLFKKKCTHKKITDISSKKNKTKKNNTQSETMHTQPVVMFIFSNYHKISNFYLKRTVWMYLTITLKTNIIELLNNLIFHQAFTFDVNGGKSEVFLDHFFIYKIQKRPGRKVRIKNEDNR